MRLTDAHGVPAYPGDLPTPQDRDRAKEAIMSHREIPGVPREAEAMFGRLCTEATLPVDVLRSQLHEHLARISAAVATNEFLDSALASAIARTAEALIDESAHRSDRDRALVQAAVRYFVLDDDADHDLESVCGLDDDAAVCNAVARALGREDLLVKS